MGDLKQELGKWLHGKRAGGKDGGPGSATWPRPGRPTPRRAERRHVAVGLDFGTSSTKVVIKLHQPGNAYAVPFPGIAREDQPCLAPTRLWVGDDLSFSLSADAKGLWVEELKVRVMEQPWDELDLVAETAVRARPADLAAGYVALVLRRVLAWFDENVRPGLGDAELVWYLNMGIPARDYDAASIRDAFLAVAQAGWHLAQTAGPVALKAARTAIDAARASTLAPNGIARDLISVVPEVAAGVTAYARSKQWVIGPHLFIDVGATTLDVSLFLLNKREEGFQYVFLAADVDSELGALRLHRHRAETLGRLALAKFSAADPLTPIPQAPGDCLPTSDEVEAMDRAFGQQCNVKIGRVVAKAKQKAPANLSVRDTGSGPRLAAQEAPIRVLLSGGGVNHPLYRAAIDETARRVAPGGGLGLRIRPFQLVQLEKPDELDVTVAGAHAWERLAIAYGLSFAIDDIGDFVPPSEVSDPAPPPVRPTNDEQLVTKDQV